MPSLSPPLAPIPDGLLRIHILGCGRGESIVLQLPNGEWGVVDCYTRDLRDSNENPILRVLKDNHVTELAFVCLTHPHADHYRGVHQLFQKLKVRHFWRFCVTDRELLKVAQADRNDAERNWELDKVDSIDSLLDDLVTVGRQQSANELQVIRPPKAHTVYTTTIGPSESPMFIQICAPSLRHQETYLSRVEDGNTNSLDHNDISLALVVGYGESRILLGGDVEERNWAQILNEEENSDGDRLQLGRVHAIKVCHHGSANGHHDDLWKILSKKPGAKPVAVICPSFSHGLPTIRGLDLIAARTSKIYVTNVDKIRKNVAKKFTFPSTVSRRDRGTLKKGEEDGLLRLTAIQAGFGRCSLSIESSGTVRVDCEPPAGKWRKRSAS